MIVLLSGLCSVRADRSAAVSAAIRRASRPPRRGRDTLGTAGKMPALR